MIQISTKNWLLTKYRSACVLGVVRGVVIKLYMGVVCVLKAFLEKLKPMRTLNELKIVTAKHNFGNNGSKNTGINGEHFGNKSL